MEEQPPLKVKRGLVPVIHYCNICMNPKHKYLASWEIGNKDYRQYCWNCAMITSHTAPIPKVLE
jgi:hypothetical protein